MTLTQISLEDVSIHRGGRPVVRGVNLHLEKGQAALVRGPNGVGKSTFLRAIAGYLPIKSGRVQTFGIDGQALPQQLHYQGHKDPIKPSQTVREQLEFWQSFLSLKPKPAGPSVYESLQRYDVAHLIDVPGAYLSQGQRRRVSLARLLACPRPLWLLDEPTAGLDLASTKVFTTVLSCHLQSGGMAICSTHLPIEIEGCKELHLERPAFEMKSEDIT